MWLLPRLPAHNRNTLPPQPPPSLPPCQPTPTHLLPQVRDPRVDTRDNEAFLDLMEAYFAQPLAAKMADARPELAYQARRRQQQAAGGCGS